MIELLEKLARLDPKICNRREDGYSVNCYSASGELWMSVCLDFDDLQYGLSPKPLAYIAAALQQAISDYPDLCYQLKRSDDGVHASIWNAEDKEIPVERVDEEAAIALLSAYVAWLQWIEVKEWLKPAIDSTG